MRLSILSMLALLGLGAATAMAAPPPIQDCPDCPALVAVPPGAFDMGTSPDEADRLGVLATNRILPWQQPKHRVAVARGFAMGKTPVTRAQYEAFAKAVGEGVAGSEWASPGIRQTDQDPVVRVSWLQAQAYVAWLSARTGKRYRLPTEAEWEYAARGGASTARWWGDDPGVNRTVCDDCGSRWDGKTTAPVASFPANAFGLHDTLGNVFQWTADCWNDSYAGAPADGSAWTTGNCSVHPIRGGSWKSDARSARAGARGRDAQTYQGNMVGLRVVRELD